MATIHNSSLMARATLGTQVIKPSTALTRSRFKRTFSCQKWISFWGVRCLGVVRVEIRAFNLFTWFVPCGHKKTILYFPHVRHLIKHSRNGLDS